MEAQQACPSDQLLGSTPGVQQKQGQPGGTLQTQWGSQLLYDGRLAGSNAMYASPLADRQRVVVLPPNHVVASIKRLPVVNAVPL